MKYSIINCRFCGPVARQPLLPWQPFCTPLIGESSCCQHTRMKLTGPPGTELRHILAVYIMYLCDLDLWPIFPRIGPRDSEVVISGGASFFWVGRPKGAKKFLGGQVYMVANSAFSQRGTHNPFLTSSQVPLLSPDLSFPFCFLWVFPFASLVHSHFLPLPSFHTARGSGRAL